ncbi:MAG: glycosyltransferase family 4 protein [bacterium]|nr:glycosyltransferase family 4 protein [bacterium]
MSTNTIRIALDLSCAMEAQLTGLGYVAYYQVRALLDQDHAFDYRLVATRPTGGRNPFEDVRNRFSRISVLPHAGLLRYHLWSRFDWPPIEWFSGAVDVAHNFSHQVPATRHALRLVTVHDLSFLRVPETHSPRNVALQSALIRQCVERADAFVTVSESTRHELVSILGVPEERVHHVPNGVCLDEFDATFDTDALEAAKKRLGIARPYFIHLGTVEPRKNIPRLVEAYARLRERCADCPQLVLVGKPGWLCEPSLEAIAAHGGAGDIVHVGYLERQEALTLLRGALGCVYPSLYEGFGLPVLEAMAARTPVITSNVSSMPEVAGGCATLVDPESVGAIADAMVSMVERPDDARANLDAAETRARTFTWERSAERLAEVYGSLA